MEVICTKDLPSFWRVLLSLGQLFLVWNLFLIKKKKKKVSINSNNCRDSGPKSTPSPCSWDNCNELSSLSWVMLKEKPYKLLQMGLHNDPHSSGPWTPQGDVLAQESRLPQAHSCCWAPLPLISSVGASVLALSLQPKCLQSHPRQVERVTPLCHLTPKWGKAATRANPGNAGVRLNYNLKDFAEKARECLQAVMNCHHCSSWELTE